MEVDPSVPFVSIDCHCNSNIPCVSSDNFSGGCIAAKRLIELGCKNLLFMRIGSSVSSEVDKRCAGFESVCHSENINHEAIILDDSETEEPLYRYLEEHITDGKPNYDGIFCNTDKLACRIINKLRELGVRVPDDVQVIGYDGIPDHVTGKVKCSTIVQPIAFMA